ncbi:hypothetical protein [Thiomicrorhabdus sp.]|uniref:hypothetical protein n=1 Tax=Thiomicrorhabdus sp. TaxID=2039724 RepID=UPI00356A530D
MDIRYVLTAFAYALVGLALGIYMAASKDHGQLVTHAHILLLGFVVSFIYGLCHKLWLNNLNTTLAKAQFYFHQTGTFFLMIGLFLLFSKALPEPVLGPILGISSILVFIGMVLMVVLFVATTQKTDV